MSTKTRTLQGEHLQKLDHMRGRFFTIVLFLTLAFVIVSVRLVHLMGPNILDSETALKKSSYTSTASPQRHNIYDRNNILVATSLRVKSLYADPRLLTNVDHVLDQLDTVFSDLNRTKLKKALSDPKRHFVWIKRHITPKQHAAILKIGEPALKFEKEYQRVYPQGALLSHVLGVTNIDGVGIAGIEKAQNDLLLNKHDKTLQLTLDIRLQDILRREMQKSIETFKAIGGSGAVMDIHTGEILAMVSLPDYDPNNPKRKITLNRNTVGVYEMGSTFKTFTTAAALDQKITALDDIFDVRKPVKVGRFKIRDYHPFKRDITTTEAYIHSSNIATALMAQNIGTDRLKSFYQDLGFFDKVAIDIPERGRPIIPKPWREAHTITSSYGHGIAVSPLHVLRATAAMVNGGTLPYPHVIARDTVDDQPKVSVISEMTSEYISALMALTVEEGTGSKAQHPHLWVGGKTGTSEKIVNGQYAEDQLLSSFVSIFPAEKPRYVALVTIDEPKGHKGSYGYATGGWTSAPVIGNVIKYMKSTFPNLQSLDKQPFPVLQKLSGYVQKKAKK